MKKRLNDIFSVSRNERIALICIIIIIAIILTYKAFSPTEKIEKISKFQTEQDFLSEIDTVKTDTLPAKNKKKRKVTESVINTASSLKMTDTF